MRSILALAILLGAQSAKAQELTVDIWVDNWFEMYVNGVKVAEDAVPITTERSFNAETFKLETELPAQVSIMVKDFKEDDSGLEYIGTDRQQMGDGGFIAQFKDTTTGTVLAVTDSTTRCLVVHRAPLDTLCAAEFDPIAGEGACDFEETAIPEDWYAYDFDDSLWPDAIEHTALDVDPKDGYELITWDESAQLIWSEDLAQDNTLLCRLTVDG